MRLYLSADIEGTCGIADWAETERATMDDYRPVSYTHLTLPTICSV